MAIRIHGTHGSWLLPEGDSILGRGEGCGIRIPDARLSRQHARLSVAGHDLWVEDLGSRNGVFIDGRRVVGRTPLRHGQVLACGPVVLMVSIDPTAPLPRRPEGHPAAAGPSAGERQDTDLMLPPVPAEPPPSRREVAPAIRAALAGSGALRPSDLLPVPQPAASASPLQPLPPPSIPTPRPQTAASATATPLPCVLPATSALEPAAPPARRQRLLAAILDGAAALLVLLLAWIVLALGVRAALALAAPGTAPAPWWHPATLAAAGPALPALARAEPLAFLVLGLAAAAATALLAALWLGWFALPSATRGAPWGHRRCGLQLVGPDGQHPSLARAAGRWLLAALLAPLALPAIARRRRSWHDTLSGCQLRRVSPMAS